MTCGPPPGGFGGVLVGKGSFRGQKGGFGGRVLSPGFGFPLALPPKPPPFGGPGPPLNPRTGPIEALQSLAGGAAAAQRAGGKRPVTRRWGVFEGGRGSKLARGERSARGPTTCEMIKPEIWPWVKTVLGCHLG